MDNSGFINIKEMIEYLHSVCDDQVDPDDHDDDDDDDDDDQVVVSGYAWAGGGRRILRVDLTGDGGNTWTQAHTIR